MIETLALLARRRASQGDFSIVSALRRAGIAAGLDMGQLGRVVAPALEVAVLRARQVVDDAEEELDTKELQARTAEMWAAAFASRLRPFAALVREAELGVILDRAANLLGSVSVKLHNDSDETAAAADLMEQAVGVASSPELASRGG